MWLGSVREENRNEEAAGGGGGAAAAVATSTAAAAAGVEAATVGWGRGRGGGGGGGSGRGGLGRTNGSSEFVGTGLEPRRRRRRRRGPAGLMDRPVWKALPQTPFFDRVRQARTWWLQCMWGVWLCRTAGRGLHSSISYLNLSRSWSLQPQQESTSQLNLRRFCH